MKVTYSYQIYSSVKALPKDWDVLAVSTVFLSKKYLEVLEKSAPNTMCCHFIGLFENEILIGIALSQFLDLNQVPSLGNRDKCFKSTIRNFILKKFSSSILLIGNNTLTGQNAFVFSENTNKQLGMLTLQKAIQELKCLFESKGKKVHLTILKDFDEDDVSFLLTAFKSYRQFSVQPNMIFTTKENWKTEQDYVGALSKKYRSQYKRARKKTNGIIKRQLSLNEIIDYEEIIYNLYIHVAQNAPFNTFFLPKNHFAVFKEHLNDHFLFYGYFESDVLIGFTTLIQNGKDLDTYFLGYDERIQKEKMMYLNMLYDIIGYAIHNSFDRIIFARTALEIKSAVGAKPVKMYGLIKHRSWIVTPFLGILFKYLEPKTVWKERNPFI